MIKKNMLKILSEAAEAENFSVDPEEFDEYDGYCDDSDMMDDGDESYDESAESDLENDPNYHFSNDGTGDRSPGYSEDLEDEAAEAGDSDDEDDIDLSDLTDEEIAEIEDEIINDYDDMDEIDDADLGYTEEMVTVISNGVNYFVEYENLAKLMKSNKYDAATAMQKIAECNGLQMGDMRLVVESISDVRALLQEKAVSKKARRKKVFQMKSSAEFLKDVKNKGIIVVKRKSRKAKRKSKKRK